MWNNVVATFVSLLVVGAMWPAFLLSSGFMTLLLPLAYIGMVSGIFLTGEGSIWFKSIALIFGAAIPCLLQGFDNYEKRKTRAAN